MSISTSPAGFSSSTVSSQLPSILKKKLLLHSVLVSLVGFLSGFMWIIAIHGGLQFWPLPPIVVEIPPSRDLMDNAHTGPIMNGLFVMAIAALSQCLSLSPMQWRFTYYGAVLMLWGNTIGYQTAVFAPNRGMQPQDTSMNVVSYFCFYFAILGLFTVLTLVIMGTVKAIRED